VIHGGRGEEAGKGGVGKLVGTEKELSRRSRPMRGKKTGGSTRREENKRGERFARAVCRLSMANPNGRHMGMKVKGAEGTMQRGNRHAKGAGRS